MEWVKLWLYCSICFSTLEFQCGSLQRQSLRMHWTPMIEEDNKTAILLRGEQSNKEMSYSMRKIVACGPDSPDYQLHVCITGMLHCPWEGDAWILVWEESPERWRFVSEQWDSMFRWWRWIIRRRKRCLHCVPCFPSVNINSNAETALWLRIDPTSFKSPVTYWTRMKHLHTEQGNFAVSRSSG